MDPLQRLFLAAAEAHRALPRDDESTTPTAVARADAALIEAALAAAAEIELASRLGATVRTRRVRKLLEDTAAWVRDCGVDPDGSTKADPGVFRDECDKILVAVLGHTCAPYPYLKGQGLPALDTAASLAGLKLSDFDFGPGLDGLPGFYQYNHPTDY